MGSKFYFLGNESKENRNGDVLALEVSKVLIFCV